MARPATTPEGRRAEQIQLAENLAAQRLRDGTASAQELIYFLKLNNPREQLEIERLKKENELVDAKIQAYKSTENTERRYIEAIEAMRRYGGYKDDPHE